MARTAGSAEVARASESAAKAAHERCPGCGWNTATSDGCCLDYAPPDEFAGHDFCPDCFTIDPGDDYCGSCGERL
jgi:hypothetical protein